MTLFQYLRPYIFEWNMIGWRIRKYVERSGHGLIWRIFGNSLEGFRKTTSNLSQDSRSLGRDSNPRLPKCEAGLLNARLERSVYFASLTISGDLQKWWVYLCNIAYYSHSLPMCPNIFILTCNLFSCLNLRDHVSHPHETTFYSLEDIPLSMCVSAANPDSS
jgi:hypothetical protein